MRENIPTQRYSATFYDFFLLEILNSLSLSLPLSLPLPLLSSPSSAEEDPSLPLKEILRELVGQRTRKITATRTEAANDGRRMNIEKRERENEKKEKRREGQRREWKKKNKRRGRDIAGSRANLVIKSSLMFYRSAKAISPGRQDRSIDRSDRRWRSRWSALVYILGTVTTSEYEVLAYLYLWARSRKSCKTLSALFALSYNFIPTFSLIFPY